MSELEALLRKLIREEVERLMGGEEDDTELRRRAVERATRMRKARNSNV